MNFANFINQQRVEYAKKALKKDENKLLTIESIGEKSGFKSKSSFNAAFKKFTGQTPSDYLKMS
jgi:AraC-like DNA-binding protein